MTKTVLLRIRVRGNPHARFWRAVGVVTPSLTIHKFPFNVAAHYPKEHHGGSPGFMGENVATAEFCPSTQLQILPDFYGYIG